MIVTCFTNDNFKRCLIKKTVLFFVTIVIVFFNSGFSFSQTTITNRNLYTTGYIPDFIPSSSQKFPISPYELYPSELKYNPSNPQNLSNVIVLYDTLTSWSYAKFNDTSIQYYFITPGDYTNLGTLNISSSGKSNKKKVIRYYNPNNIANPYDTIHPVKNEYTSKEVVLEGFFFDSASYWIIANITFRGHSINEGGFVGGPRSDLKNHSNHNIISKCLFSKVRKAAGIAIMDSDYNTIQHCVFKDRPLVPGDKGGVLIRAQQNGFSRGNVVAANEFKNMTDALGLTNSADTSSLTGEIPGTVIVNNDIYCDSTFFKYIPLYNDTIEMACSENGLDIKNGTSSPLISDKILIIGNRIFGFRPCDTACGGTGAAGTGIVLHLQAQNVLLKDNIVFDCSSGIHVKKGLPNSRIAIVNNLFYEMDNSFDSTVVTGHSLRTESDSLYVYYNTFHTADRALKLVPSHIKYNRFQCNTFVSFTETSAYTDDNTSWSGLNSWFNYPDQDSIYKHGGANNTFGQNVNNANLTNYTIYVKRWTNPTPITFYNAIPSFPNYPGPQIIPQQGCDCASNICDNGWMGINVIYNSTNQTENQNIGYYNLYPNPTNSIILLDGIKGNETQEVYDVYGNLIFNSKGLNKINFENFSNGIYFLSINKGERIFKIVKVN